MSPITNHVADHNDYARVSHEQDESQKVSDVALGYHAARSAMNHTRTHREAGRPAEPVTVHVALGRVGGTKPWPSESASRQSGNRVGHPAELADRSELAALAHGPAAQLLRVGVNRV